MAKSAPAPRKRGCLPWAIAGVIVIALGAGVTWANSSIQQAQWHTNSGTQNVGVQGARSGDGYEISDSATVETNARYSETVVHLPVSRKTNPPSRTPLVAVEIGNDGIRCETDRSWIWSTEEGSTLDLACRSYIDLETLRGIDTITVVASL